MSELIIVGVDELTGYPIFEVKKCIWDTTKECNYTECANTYCTEYERLEKLKNE